MPTVTRLKAMRGCLLGGALGDALGAPVEFLSLDQIIARYGAQGIRRFAHVYGREGAITDDTQMTLFTADGLVRGLSGPRSRHALPEVMHESLLSWLTTQGKDVPQSLLPAHRRSPLLQIKALHARRAPGATCLSSLRKTKRLGGFALNDSKGCGAVMRVAPIGLVFEPETAFSLASECAQHTHGHPASTLSSGCFAALIAHLVRGDDLASAVSAALRFLEGQPAAATVTRIVQRAVRLAEAQQAGAACTVTSIGAGWVAEEALAIAIYCALVAPNFEEALALSVNHDGDSDSTGSITGQILGALHGDDALPTDLLKGLELRLEIEHMAQALSEITVDLEQLMPATPSLPPFARTALNRCNLPPSILGGLTFQAQPVPLKLDGVRVMHRELFEKLHELATEEERKERFADYMTVHFRLEHLDELGYDQATGKNQRVNANYRRIVRGWSFNPDGREAAVVKRWVESRFGLLTRYHGGPLGNGETPAREAFIAEAMDGVFGTNSIEAQLDLLYTYCQYELRRRYPERDHIVLFRGLNALSDHEVLAEGPYGRHQLLLNNVSSFSQNPQRAEEFGDMVLRSSIPLSKIAFFEGLLPRMLRGEEEYVVLGGVIEAKRVSLV